MNTFFRPPQQQPGGGLAGLMAGGGQPGGQRPPAQRTPQQGQPQRQPVPAGAGQPPTLNTLAGQAQ